MSKSHRQRSPGQQGVLGLDVFKIAGRSISGFVHGYKTGSKEFVRHAYTTTLERYLALYLEYHPLVRAFQRGDAHEACVKRYHLPAPLGTPYPIPYEWDSSQHNYFPDFVGTLVDGGLFIAEAGLSVRKYKGQEVAKADAARLYARLRGGDFWICTESSLSTILYENLKFLHAQRPDFSTYEAIRDALRSHWPYGQFQTPRDLVAQLAPHWSEHEVEGAVWKCAGDAAAQGQLLFDLASQQLTLDAPLALQDPSFEPILPPPLPSQILPGGSEEDADEDERGEWVRDGESDNFDGVSRGSIDPSSISSEEQRRRFERLRSAVYEVQDGYGLRATASKYELSASNLSRLLARWRVSGDVVLLPHRLHRGSPRLHPDVRSCIAELYSSRQQLTNRQIHEHHKLKRIIDRLYSQDPCVRMPSYRQICLEVARLERQKNSGGRSPSDLRAGARYPPREAQSTMSYVLSRPYPGGECQVDEHFLDVRIVTRDNEQVTMRVYAAVLVCVKTAAILGFVLSPHELTEDDYMRLIKQAMEPKDYLTDLYECEHEWPCYAKPLATLYDRGKIFTSKRASDVMVDRLNILQERAPAYVPPVKGTVEAIFWWVIQRFTHRLPGTTKSNPRDRGGYDSEAEALRAGITFDVLEQLFTRAVVDDYMQDFDSLRRQRRFRLWNDAVAETGVARYLGSPDDLKLLLMRAHNFKNPKTGAYKVHPVKGISFRDRWYVNPEVTPRLRGDEVTIYYDQRDIVIIYIYLNGVYMGPVYCTTLTGRVSIWEADAMRARDRREQAQASAETTDARRKNIAAASAGKAAQKRVARELERKRALDQQRSEIHPESALALAEAIDQSRRAQGLSSQFVGDGIGAPPESSASQPVSRRSRVSPPVPNDALAPSQLLTSRPRLTPVLRAIPTQPSAPQADAEAIPGYCAWDVDTACAADGIAELAEAGEAGRPTEAGGTPRSDEGEQ